MQTALTVSDKHLPMPLHLGINLQAGLNGEYNVSVYRGNLTKEGIAAYGKKIRVAFPKLFADKTKEEQRAWAVLFSERLKENGFTDERLKDAVNYVIDNYSAWNREPQISDFISFDKKIKCWTYPDLMEKYKEAYYVGAKVDPIAAYFERADMGLDYPLYVTKSDFKKYNLKPFENKPAESVKVEAAEGLPQEYFAELAKITFSGQTDEAIEKQLTELNHKYGIEAK